MYKYTTTSLTLTVTFYMLYMYVMMSFIIRYPVLSMLYHKDEFLGTLIYLRILVQINYTTSGICPLWYNYLLLHVDTLITDIR